MSLQNYEHSLLVEISPDKLIAYVSLKQLSDTSAFKVDELTSFLHSKGIVYGLLHDNMKLFCKDPLRYLNKKLEIARGDAPTKGQDGYVEYAYKQKTDVFPAADFSTEAKIDFKQVSKLDNVIKGQLIASLVPPKLGKVGKSVDDEDLTPMLGKPARFKIGKNVVVNKEGTALYAAIDGLISLTDNGKINVFPVYEVHGDVDYSIGNIEFVGTVVIRGNVLTGFKVKASGDIRIVGGVEGAVLESEGNIEITGGIMASNKGFIKAKNDLKCSFIQDANIDVGRDVIVSQSIMHSQVRAGNNVICNVSKGLIVGGQIQAGKSVHAKTIGNSMSTVTTIEVGIMPVLREEQLSLRASIKEQVDNLDSSEKALVILDQMAATGKLTPERFAMRQKLLNSKQQIQLNVTQIKERLLEIEKQLEGSVDASVCIKQSVYGGVKIVIGRYTKYIKDSMSSVKFIYEDGDIVLKPLF